MLDRFRNKYLCTMRYGHMKIYLAARFGRQREMQQVRDRLVLLGHEVTSRWLCEEPTAEDDLDERRKWAMYDYQDVLSSDAIINFTEPPGGCGRGGRHVEFGLAAAWGKRLFVVGHRENVFHSLPQVEYFGTVDQVIDVVARSYFRSTSPHVSDHHGTCMCIECLPTPRHSNA